MKELISLLTFIHITSHLCAIRSEGNFDNFVCPFNCYCNITNPYVNRHRIVCPSENPKVEISLYETLTLHDYSVVAECHTFDQYVYGILSQFDLTSAKQAFFYNCSLPRGNKFGSATTMNKLKTLTIRQSNFTTLPAEYFDELVDLQELDLSKNRLTSFPVGFFDKFSKLTQLYLNDNQFKSLTDVMAEKPATLKRLEVKHNLIEDITKRDLEVFNRDIVVSVDGNLIQFISSTPFVVPKRYKDEIGFFELSGNPFDCSCHAKDFIHVTKIWNDYVPFFTLTLKCATPEKHAGKYVWSFTEESICAE